MSHVVRTLSSVVCSVPLTLTLFAGAAAAQLEPFNVYGALGEIPPAALQPVVVSDQFGTVTTGLGPASLLMVPAMKNGEPLLDSASHLTATTRWTRSARHRRSSCRTSSASTRSTSGHRHGCAFRPRS